MTEAESKSGPRFCRQCGRVVPEGTAICPSCGKRWYMDRVEQQGVELWQKIVEKRSESGIGEPAGAPDQKQYRCPNCMALLPAALPTCPHCGKSTERTKIFPQLPDEEVSGNIESEGPSKMKAARGLAAIKGAGKKAGVLLTGGRRLKKVDIIIIAAIVVIIVAIGVLLAVQYGALSSLLPAAKPAATQTALPAAVPVISNIKVSSATNNSVDITWTTDLPSYGKVIYGKSERYGLTLQSSKETEAQVVNLSGLDPATSYHFAIAATDKDGKELTRSLDQTFSTVAQRSGQPPVVSQFNAMPSDTSAIVTWITDKPATGQALYGLDESCSESTSVDSRLVTDHSIRVAGLQPGYTYYYRIKSVDADGNQAVMDPPDSFTTYISVPMGSSIGDRAPDFTLPLFNSQDSISLRSYKGQKVLLTFWAVYCPECDRELALLQAISKRNQTGVTVIGIFLESKPEDINKTIAQFKSRQGELTFPICVDAYKTTAHLYNVEKVPCTFFIDGDFIVRDIEFGNFNIDQVQQVLNSL